MYLSLSVVAGELLLIRFARVSACNRLSVSVGVDKSYTLLRKQETGSVSPQYTVHILYSAEYLFIYIPVIGFYSDLR